jgi:hypothetical protein
MKNSTKRFALGFLSSLLLAVGLARAADLLDPLTLSLPATQAAATGTAPDTIINCTLDGVDQ